jgi:hypothetical protein
MDRQHNGQKRKQGQREKHYTENSRLSNMNPTKNNG